MQADGDLISRIHGACRDMAGGDAFLAVARIGEVFDVLAAEQAIIANAVDTRRAEFAAGRWCARRALALAGGPRAAILRGRLHEPLWPDGFTGSITHDGRFAAAMVCRIAAGVDARFGIDLVDQADMDRFAPLADMIVSPQDRQRLDGFDLDGAGLARVFSAKEAAVKIFSGFIGHFMNLVDVGVAPSAGGFLVSHGQVDGYVLAAQRIVEGIILTVAQFR